MQNAILPILDMLDATFDEQGVRRAIRKLTDACGFDIFTYVEASGTTLKTISSYPIGWQRTYLSRRYSRLDPVMAKAKRIAHPFSWSIHDWERSCLTRDQQRVCDQAISYGLRSGVSIPVRGPFGKLLMLTMASSRNEAPRIADSEMELLRTVTLIAHYRIPAGAEIAVERFGSTLTPKEAVCLTWAARGKYMPEIANITNTQYRTVQHYLDNARAKLGASNLTHAVALAKDCGLIG